MSDDPEGAAVFADCLLQWRALPDAVRRRILLVTLPLEDADENAVMVNALQRHAAVIAQKSLAEGFGLTVAEGMWKARPVIGSAVGGIIDQIADGTGILLPDPRDLGAFGAAVRLAAGGSGRSRRDGEGGAGLHWRALRRRPAPAQVRRSVRRADGLTAPERPRAQAGVTLPLASGRTIPSGC